MFKKRREAKMRRAGIAEAQSELRRLRREMDGVRSVFNSTSDPSITEACIFEMNALRARYDHAVKNARTYFL